LEVCFGVNLPTASSGTLGAPPYAAIENNAEKRKELKQ